MGGRLVVEPEHLGPAAEQGRRPAPQQESPASGTVQIPRQRRWFGVAALGP